MTDALHYQTILELSSQIRSGDLSPLTLTEALLARIEALDGRLKSYATVMAESALAEARTAEVEIAAGRYLGPLHGIPIAVKDLCYTKGVRTMGGCAVLADHVPDFDATVVRRFRDAGAVLLGKLNLTEGAMAGYNPAFDVPENPWKESHWSGASSSGSGAATAAGLAFATLGSDTGGSIRHPAAACGTVGLKPTWGRVSRHGVLDLAQSLDHVGPLTRSSADAGIVMQAISGLDPDDPTTLVAPVPDMLAGLEAGVKGLRIGWDERYASEDIAPGFAAAIAAAVEVMAGLGAEIVEVSMPARLRDYLAAWGVLCTAEAADAHRATYPARAAEYGPWFREWLARGNAFSAADYAQANNLRAACVGAMRQTMRDIDLLACPSTARAAYPVTPEISYGPIPERDPWQTRFTVPMDYAGLPTISLPCGLSEQGLPLSLQFVGHPLAEPLLVQAGAAYESATEWHRMHPPGW
ncbi:MAG: amidase [Rhodospirillaceae bacterium]|jgi:amidase|nr:amidase [Rhodospirillaceae bacterium]MBT3491266.1 amidase [Rhodospirillaceae bacterium]MBT3782724.1 amidase [Rhodospirillaceae bacterium]MBT3979569.1 amidase [Rhodospirillaceae bacterium]MBT4168083.1 amidase [Rhodospirillaceae bacterium]